jgi:hypothetical protein
VAAGSVFSSSRVLGANDRVRFGLIGAGGRGLEDLHAALKAPNFEAVAVADLYTRRLDQAKEMAPQAKTYKDFRHILDDNSIDAVLIATPQHQHVLQFVPALQPERTSPGKTLAFNPITPGGCGRRSRGHAAWCRLAARRRAVRPWPRCASTSTTSTWGRSLSCIRTTYRNAPSGLEAAHSGGLRSAARGLDHIPG